MPARLPRTAGSVLIWLVGLALAASAVGKLAAPAPVREQLLGHGITWPRTLGAVELAAAVLLLAPLTRRVGLLLCVAYLGGATAVSFGDDGFAEAVPSMVLQALLWTGAALATPDLLGPLTARRGAGGDEGQP